MSPILNFFPSYLRLSQSEDLPLQNIGRDSIDSQEGNGNSNTSAVEFVAGNASSNQNALDPRPRTHWFASYLRVTWQKRHKNQDFSGDLERGRVIPPPPEEILANVYDPIKSFRNFGVVARKGGFWGGAIYGSYALAQYEMAEHLAPENMATAQGFLYMGLPAVAAKPAYEFLEGTYKAFGKNARIFPIEAMKKNHENDKAHFAKVQEIISVPEYITRPAKIVDDLIDKDLARFQRVGTENVSADELELTDRRRNWKLNYITRRPTGLRAIEDWKTPEGRKELDRRVEEALEDVNESDKEFIRLLVDRVCGTSVEYVRYREGLLATTPAEQRAAANDIELYKARGANFIVKGNPGVGKSYTIKNVLGKAAGATVIEITIPSDEDGGFSVLIPKDWDILHQTGFVPKPEDVLGKIIEALMEGKCENIVLYFNEVNARSPQTRDGFKRLLDRVNEFIKNTPLATMFYIAPVTIVIDLNPGDENDEFINDPAIIDRCIIHEFSPAVTVGLAAKRLRAAFEEHAIQSCHPMQNDKNPREPHPPVLNDGQQRKLHTMFDQVFPALLKEHMTTTGSARTEFVGMLVPYIAHALRTNQPKTKAEIESYIREHYLKLRKAQGQEEPKPSATADIEAWLKENHPGQSSAAGEDAESNSAQQTSFEAYMQHRAIYIRENRAQPRSSSELPDPEEFQL